MLLELFLVMANYGNQRPYVSTSRAFFKINNLALPYSHTFDLFNFSF